MWADFHGLGRTLISRAALLLWPVIAGTAILGAQSNPDYRFLDEQYGAARFYTQPLDSLDSELVAGMLGVLAGRTVHRADLVSPGGVRHSPRWPDWRNGRVVVGVKMPHQSGSYSRGGLYIRHWNHLLLDKTPS